MLVCWVCGRSFWLDEMDKWGMGDGRAGKKECRNKPLGLGCRRGAAAAAWMMRISEIEETEENPRVSLCLDLNRANCRAGMCIEGAG